MKRGMMTGMIAATVIGATVGMYAASQMSPRERRKMMKRSRKMMEKATHMMGGMNMF